MGKLTAKGLSAYLKDRKSRDRYGIIMFNKSAEMETNSKLRNWKPLKKGSKEQMAIWKAMETSQDNLVVNAYAGTGKTTTCLEGLMRITKGQGPECSTSHSMLLSVLKEHWPKVEIHRFKVHDIVNKLMGIRRGNPVTEEKMQLRDSVVGLVSAYKNTLLPPTKENFYIICDRFGLDLGKNEEEVAGISADAWSRSLEQQELVDFDDMLFYPAFHGLEPAKKFKFLVVDEAQDYNVAQRVGSLLLAERLMFIGDRYQCQPPGTMVRLTGGGLKPIEQLEVGDQLVSFNSKQTYFPGTNTQGRKVEEIASREYSGELITIFAGGKKVKSTPEHKWLVRLTERESYALYLMVKGTSARVGISRLMYPHSFGPGMRARQEGADKSYLLDVFYNAEHARIMEVITAAKFGLPQTVFKNTGQQYPTQEFIDEVFDGIGDNLDKAKQCVTSFGRRWEYPIWERNGNTHIGTKSFVTQACNLINGVFRVCVYTGDARKPNWTKAQVSRSQYQGMVYSLKVEPTEGGRRLYLANDVVSHNSIYSFRGADANSIPNIITELQTLGKMKEFPLTVSRRCCHKVVESVLDLVPEFKAMKDAPQGLVEWKTQAQGREMYKPGDMVLCRTNAPLCSEAFALLASNRKCKISGRDFGKSLVNFVKKMKAEDVPDLVECLEDYRQKELDRLKAKAKYRPVDNLVDAINDKVNCIEVFCKGNSTIDQVLWSITDMFDDDIKDRKKIVLLSSIHKAKGDESKRVFIVNRDQMPSNKAKNEEQRQQEKNIIYVGHTRAMLELYLLESTYQTKD